MCSMRLRSPGLKPQSGGREEPGAAPAPGSNATNKDKKPQRGDRAEFVSVSPTPNRVWNGINGNKRHELPISVAPRGLLAGCYLAKTGAEAVPGTTRSSLCGLLTMAGLRRRHELGLKLHGPGDKSGFVRFKETHGRLLPRLATEGGMHDVGGSTGICRIVDEELRCH